MNRTMARRIDELESSIGNGTLDEWQYNLVISAGGTFVYLRNSRTGERSFDSALINQFDAASAARYRAGKYDTFVVDYENHNATEHETIMQEAIAAGVISAPNVQRAANLNDYDNARAAAEIIAIDRNSNE